MNQIRRARSFVKAHPTVVAVPTALAVGALAVAAFYHGKTLLEITPQHVRLLQDNGGYMLYETAIGNLLVKAETYI